MGCNGCADQRNSQAIQRLEAAHRNDLASGRVLNSATTHIAAGDSAMAEADDRIVNPIGEVGTVGYAVLQSGRRSDRATLRIGLLDNSKPNAEYFLDALA